MWKRTPAALSKVYTFGPTFRAENSNTTRHLAEFWMIEPEIAFADLADDADLAERFLKAIFRDLLNERPDDMKFFNDRIDDGCIERVEKFVDASFDRMDYTDAIKHLEAAVAKGVKFEFPVSWGMDLQSEHERYLTEELVGRPVVVMNYPKDIKAVLHATERRRKNRRDHGCACTRDRRDHWRITTRGAAGCLGPPHRGVRSEIEPYWWYRDLRVRHGATTPIWFGLRARFCTRPAWRTFGT